MREEKEGAGGQVRLINDVIRKGICVRCGACVGLCPYFEYLDGEVVVMDRCRAEDSKCLQICPRAGYPETDSAPVIGRGEEGGGEIGPHKAIFAARSRSDRIRERAQYGGVVSSLLVHALERGYIRSSVLTDAGRPLSPTGVTVEDEAGVLSCAGSRYSGSGGLAALNRALKSGREDLCVVGLPCQLEAVARMERKEPEGEEIRARIKLKMGLFCTWALGYRALRSFLEKKGVEDAARKFDIPPPPSEKFQVLTEKGWRDFPLSEVRPMIQKGCSLCLDMTAENADLSVGVVEGREGWNTLIVRTEKGAELVREAVAGGCIETEPLPRENIEHLKNASVGKKKRGKAAREEMFGGAS